MCLLPLWKIAKWHEYSSRSRGRRCRDSIRHGRHVSNLSKINLIFRRDHRSFLIEKKKCAATETKFISFEFKICRGWTFVAASWSLRMNQDNLASLVEIYKRHNACNGAVKPANFTVTLLSRSPVGHLLLQIAASAIVFKWDDLLLPLKRCKFSAGGWQHLVLFRKIYSFLKENLFERFLLVKWSRKRHKLHLEITQCGFIETNKQPQQIPRQIDSTNSNLAVWGSRHLVDWQYLLRHVGSTLSKNIFLMFIKI